MADLTLYEKAGILSATISPEGVGFVAMTDEAGANALSHAMVEGLTEAFALLGRDERVRVIVLTGIKTVFCSGASREVLDDLISGRRDIGELELPRVLLDCPVPCIAALEGYAVGGGFALGVAADLIVLARESRYCFNFMDLGFTPGMGTTRLLEHVLSTAVATELLLTGQAVLGRELAGRSGINHIVQKDEVWPTAIDLATRIAQKPRGALVALKRTLSLPRRQAFEAARTQETLMHVISFAQPGLAAMVRTAVSSDPQEERPS